MVSMAVSSCVVIPGVDMLRITNRNENTDLYVFYIIYLTNFISLHQHISTSAHQHISTSAHQHISTSAHQHISTSAHQHISTSAHQHISTSAHQHISTSTHQHISTSAHQHIFFISFFHPFSALSITIFVQPLKAAKSFSFSANSRLNASSGTKPFSKNIAFIYNIFVARSAFGSKRATKESPYKTGRQKYPNLC